LEIIMYDHIGLKVSDLDASVRFYSAALTPLGYGLCSRDESGAGFGPRDAPALWLYPHKGSRGAGAHIAFRAPDHAAIKKFHAAGLKAGGRDNGAAGPHADYSPSYFAAFLIDPDGNNVEAVCP
jgi:catechol 2,3-dioxygenase-like lactoylglutathione lyase family enzyme